jgi:hypothetical protein
MRVLALMERINFGFRQVFNVIILGTVEQAFEIKEVFNENRSSTSEIGYISCVYGQKSSGRNQLTYFFTIQCQVATAWLSVFSIENSKALQVTVLTSLNRVLYSQDVFYFGLIALK